VTLVNKLINSVHHGELRSRQRELLIALLLHLAAASNAMAYCPEMINVQTAYRELLAAGGADQWGS
jgi:hypothetical protein